MVSRGFKAPDEPSARLRERIGGEAVGCDLEGMNRTLLAFMLAACSVTTAQVPEYVPAEGLVGWWSFDGDVEDDGPMALSSTSEGVGLEADRFGFPDMAAAFDGLDDQIRVLHSDSLNLTEELTVVAWIKSVDIPFGGNSHCIAAKRDEANYPSSIGTECPWTFSVNYQSWIEDRKKLLFGYQSNNDWSFYQSQDTISTEVWAHVAMTVFQDSIVFYHNSEVIGFHSVPLTGRSTNSSDMLIGSVGREAGAEYFKGSMDDLGIWNRALSPTEIQTLFTLTPLGCTDASACNYDSEAIIDDGSCSYPPVINLGDDIETCEDAVILDAGEGFDHYHWNTGDTVQELITTESFTYTVSASLLGDWIWTSGEELSISYWNSIVLNPYALCAEMYDSDGFMAESCDLEKYFVLELPDLNEPISDPALAGFTYVDPAYMAAYNAGLTTPLSSNYYLSNEQASFYAAQDICESHGGHLVAINSEAENEFVANIDGAYFGCGNDCDGFWIGLQRAICTVTDEIFVDFDDCDAYCGEGTVWDPFNQECIVAIPTDTDFDGCVAAGDLLNLLGTFGSCPPIPFSGPCQGPDHVTYQGYDYDIVAIGDQCWFAENLRAENYRNGDEIESGISDADWGSLSGATSVYGEGTSDCESFAPDGDACIEDWPLVQYGRLYNWYAVDDERGLCPFGWHVPSLSHWTDLTAHLDSLGDAGFLMKTSTGWSNNGGGSNDSGFSGLPTGYRNWDGSFQNAGKRGYWWSCTPHPSESDAWAYYIRLVESQNHVDHFHDEAELGFAIRCIKD